MRIFLVGGGSGGPTTPLLAVAEAVLKLEPKAEFFFVGTNPEQEKPFLTVVNFPIQYLSIPAGKWRRYFSLKNFLDLFKIFFGFFKSLYLIGKYRPDIIFGAGSFVQVPVFYAAFFRQVPVIAHQQDFLPLLSTKLVSPIASAITVSFSYTGKDIPESSGLFAKHAKSKIFVTGNPVRQDLFSGSKSGAKKFFSLNDDYPVLFVTGGGTGSEKLNQIISDSLPELVKYVQIIHVTGGKISEKNSFSHPHYHPYDFLKGELKDAFAAADLIVSRGGMATISEIARLGKPAVLIPLPDSTQEVNVKILMLLNLVVGIPQNLVSPGVFTTLVRKMLWSEEAREMARNLKNLMPEDSDKLIAKLLVKTYNKARR